MAPNSPATQKHMTHIDRPEISEAYADLLGRGFYDGTTLRMEFLVNRMNDPQPDGTLTGFSVTACRVIMPLSGVLDMIEKLQSIVRQVQTNAALRQAHFPPDQGERQPN